MSLHHRVRAPRPLGLALGLTMTLAATLSLASCGSDDATPSDGSTGAGPGEADTSSSAPLEAPAGDAFYEPPSDLGADHGSLIWSRPFDGEVSLDDATNTAFLYTQIGIETDIVATSAFVAVPEGTAPEGGWPVVAWAHGTTGIADVCAPTRLELADDGLDRDDLLQGWVDAGYAVVLTDYEGLGTPGDHPYLIGKSEGRAVLDSVEAARQLDPTLGSKVVLAGHSQGGHAALWAAGLAPTYTADLDIVGTVALAPPSHLSAQMTLLTTQDSADATATVALILRGQQIADPGLDAEALLAPAADALYPDTLTTCLSELGEPSSYGGLALNKLLGKKPDLDPLRAGVEDSDPGRVIINTPVFIGQGTADTTVVSVFTSSLADELTAKGTDVDYEEYDGATHGSILEAARSDADDFMASAFGSGD